MAKWQNDSMLDAALSYISTNLAEMVVCSAQPTTYAEATSTYALADVAVTSANVTGPANGSVSGRKITIDEQTGVTVDATGTATHVALVSADTLLYVDTCTSQSLTSGTTITIPAWDIEIRDAA